MQQKEYRQCVYLGKGEAEEGTQQEPVCAVSLIKASCVGKEFLGSVMLLQHPSMGRFPCRTIAAAASCPQKYDGGDSF